MSQVQIRRKRTKIERKIQEIEGQLKLAKTELSILQDTCTHPNLRKYSAMGEIGNICDDCGYQD